MFTPPSASMTLTKPRKLTSMKSLIVSPVARSTVATVSRGPPRPNAAEICRAGWPRARDRAAQGDAGPPGRAGDPVGAGGAGDAGAGDAAVGGVAGDAAAGGVGGAGDAAATGCGRLPGEPLPPAIAPL